MMKSAMCTESASRNKERMLEYKIFAAAFSYPDEKFFKFFPDLSAKKDSLISEYDRLFRAKEVWLYTVEYIAKNEFQRSNYLADIMGFYKAFGVEPDRDRPDSLSGELEFMHYLIFKNIHALEDKEGRDVKEKVAICLDAQKKFFAEHLYPAAKKIAEKIISMTENNFYTTIAKEFLEFLESENLYLHPRV